MTETVSLWMLSGQGGCNVQTLNTLLPEPAIAWVEPRLALPKNKAVGPAADFCGVVRGWPRWTDATEMRLSWTEAQLHLLLGEGGIWRWCAMATSREALKAPVADTPQPVELSGLTEEKQPVLWRVDLNRFLGRGDYQPPSTTAHPKVDKAAMRLFWQGARLVSWWLTPNGDGGHADSL